MEAQQVFFSLPGAVRLHNGDREAVGRGGEHSRCQGMVVLVQELVKRVLLHVDLIEFVGPNEDAVVGEVDTAAGL